MLAFVVLPYALLGFGRVDFVVLGFGSNFVAVVAVVDTVAVVDRRHIQFAAA